MNNKSRFPEIICVALLVIVVIIYFLGKIDLGKAKIKINSDINRVRIDNLQSQVQNLETELRRNKGSACRLDFGAIIPLEGEINEVTIRSGEITELKSCLPYLDKVETKQIEGKE